jgi:hypothetical protein
LSLGYLLAIILLVLGISDIKFIVEKSVDIIPLFPGEWFSLVFLWGIFERLLRKGLRIKILVSPALSGTSFFGCLSYSSAFDFRSFMGVAEASFKNIEVKN